jgi:hypothetical protein
MRTAARSAILFTAGSAILASAALHGLVNVPHLRRHLLATGVHASTLGAVTLVLSFSVVAMVAFAGLVLGGAASTARGVPHQPAALWIVAATYVVFGTAAYVLIGHSPHYLGYAAMGALVAAGAAIRPAHGTHGRP